MEFIGRLISIYAVAFLLALIFLGILTTISFFLWKKVRWLAVLAAPSLFAASLAAWPLLIACWLAMDEMSVFYHVSASFLGNIFLMVGIPAGLAGLGTGLFILLAVWLLHADKKTLICKIGGGASILLGVVLFSAAAMAVLFFMILWNGG